MEWTKLIITEALVGAVKCQCQWIITERWAPDVCACLFVSWLIFSRHCFPVWFYRLSFILPENNWKVSFIWFPGSFCLVSSSPTLVFILWLPAVASCHWYGGLALFKIMLSHWIQTKPCFSLIRNETPSVAWTRVQLFSSPGGGFTPVISVRIKLKSPKVETKKFGKHP